MAITLGDAQVKVRPNLREFQRDLTREINQAGRRAAAPGRELGRAVAEPITGAVKQMGQQLSLELGRIDRHVSGSSSSWGRLAGGVTAATGRIGQGVASLAQRANAGITRLVSGNDTLSRAWSRTQSAIGSVTSRTGAIITRWGSSTSGVLSGIGTRFVGMGRTVGDALGRVGGVITSAGRSAFRGLGRIGDAAAGLGSRFTSMAGTAGTAVAALGAGVGIAAVGIVKSTFGMSSELERAELQFKTLFGRTGDAAARAKEHVASLFEFAKKTPFETGPIIQASRLLQTFGEEALNNQANLTLIGDAAAGASQNIDEVAFWVGRAYSMMQAGKPWGEAAMRLTEMGLMTAKGRVELEKMTESGASGMEIWRRLQQELGRFTGSMVDQATTWGGLKSTLKDVFALSTAAMTRPIFDAAKKIAGALAGLAETPAFERFVEAMSGMLAGLERPLGRFVALIAEKGPAALDKLTRFIERLSTSGLSKLAPLLTAVAVGGFGKMLGSLNAMAGPLAGLIPQFNPLVGIFTVLALRSPEARDALIELGSVIATSLAQTLKALAPILNTVASAIGPIVAALAQALLPVVKALGPALGPLLIGFMAFSRVNRTVGAIREVGGAFQFIAAKWPRLAAALQGAGPIFGKLGSAASAAGSAVATGARQFATGVASIATSAASVIASGARMAAGVAVSAATTIASWVATAASAVATAATVVASWIVAAAPFILIGAVVAAVVIAIIAHWDKVKTVLLAIWGAIKAAASFVWTWIKNLIINTSPVLLIIKHWSTIRDFVLAVWNALRAAASAVWSWIRNTITSITSGIRNSVVSAWQWIGDRIRGVWNALKSAASSVWNAITGAIKTGVNGAIKLINGFIGLINKAIDLVNKVIPGGSWDIKFRVSELGYLARGGRVGPGFETRGPTAIVGEGKRGYPEFVIPTDPAYRRNALALYEKLGASLMAEGGVLGTIAGWGKRALGWVAETALKGLGGLLKVPGFGGGLAGGIASGIVNTIREKVLDGFLAWTKEKGSPPLSGGVGWEKMWAALKAQFPGAALISAFRPGAITATGNPSYHGKGRAIDVSPWASIGEWIRERYMAPTREMIFSPMGSRQIHNGSNHYYTGITRANHWDHVHWAMKRGGYLARGGMLSPNHFTFQQPMRANAALPVSSPYTDARQYQLSVATQQSTGSIRQDFALMEALSS